MAARTRKTTLSDSWKQKIQTTMLINRLNSHIFDGVEISPTQMRAIEILLKKVAPDLKAIEQTTELHADVEVYAWEK